MRYKPELEFFIKILNNFNLPINIVSESMEDFPEVDFGLRRQIFGSSYLSEIFSNRLSELHENTIYWYRDEFLCRYTTLRLPDYEDSLFMIIGPYTQTEFPHQTIQEILERFHVPPKSFPQFEKFYSGLTILPDETTFFTLINTFGEQIWHSFENFRSERIVQNTPGEIFEFADAAESPNLTYKDSEDSFLKMESIERQYLHENQLIQAVSQGNANKAEMMIPNNANQGIEQRLPDTIRNHKNYSIILNTLLRKAAEYGSVPFIHIDSLSSKFAQKIELIHSTDDALTLRKEMVHKYCLLVKNHSMKGYSLLVRKVLTYVDADLTADLSLRAQADRLNINASYLSTLFKKETGSTLTDYVNHKRIEHALLLLNTTNMQIQTIAQYCGIPDVNYFTKTFKKITGKTPKDYRNRIRTIEV